MPAHPIGDLLAAKTYDQLEQENTDLHRIIRDLERRLTSAVVRNAEKDRRTWAAATSTAHDQLQFRADQYWAIALSEVKVPLDGLIHRAKTLGDKPKRDKVAALAVAALAVQDAVDRGGKAADDIQQPLREMTADRDRLHTLIGVAAHALHSQLGRPYDSRTGPCGCAGCELRLDMNAPQEAAPQSSADGRHRYLTHRTAATHQGET